MKQTPWFGLATSLSCSLGLHLLYHKQGSLSDVGTPPTWEKGSHLPPGTIKFGNLRDSCNSITAPTAKPDLGFFSSVSSPPRDARNVTGHTGMLGELVGSHTKVAIYPTYTICSQKVVICALLDTGFKGMQVVTYPTNCQTTEVRLTKSSPKKIWVHAHQ